MTFLLLNQCKLVWLSSKVGFQIHYFSVSVLSWIQNCQRDSHDSDSFVNEINTSITSNIFTYITVLSSAICLLQYSQYCIPVTNLSRLTLLLLLSPWVPYMTRLLSAETKHVMYSNYYNRKFILCTLEMFVLCIL